MTTTSDVTPSRLKAPPSQWFGSAKRSSLVWYAARRLVVVVPQLLLVSMLTFIGTLLTPGNPARAQLGSFASAQAVHNLEVQQGLNAPPIQRYLIYLGRLVHGDFGQSWVSGHSVTSDLLTRGPATFELITMGLLGALVVAIPLGVLSAVKHEGIVGRVVERASSIYALMAGAIPDFWLALILIFIFYSIVKIAPAPIGQLSLNVAPPPRVTGMIVVDSLISGDWTALGDSLAHLALPVLTLTFVNAAPILRMTRNMVLSTSQAEFVRFGRANGLSPGMVKRYTLRNAAPPIITLGGVIYAQLVAGAVLTETIFSWGGVGQYAVQSVVNADWAALEGVIVVAAAFSLLTYLVIDLVHAAVDPRYRL